jgi:hypothetical protein
LLLLSVEWQAANTVHKNADSKPGNNRVFLDLILVSFAKDRGDNREAMADGRS